MTKNALQTVRIYSADGNLIGTTYPKRASGLVKKGRAHFDVNGCDIHLNVSDVNNITEDTTMMDNNTNIDLNKEQPSEAVNKLYFNAREWSFNKDCKNNVGSRSFMNGPDDQLSEAFMIGDWGYNWTEIVSKTLILPKNTLNTFTFWLNGGENDNNNEICRFEVIFNNDWEGRFSYNLNRSFIKPLKKLNGWELYEIPFRTSDNEYTQLRFVAQRAYMTVMAAKDVSAYADIPDNADEFEKYRPQRHNIVFEDGWPTNTWYSTRSLAAKYTNSESDVISQFRDQIRSIRESGEETLKRYSERPQHISIHPNFLNDDTQNAIYDTADNIQSIVEQTLAGFNLDELKEDIKSTIKSSLESGANISPDNIDDIIGEVISGIENSFEDAIDSLNDAVDNINDSLNDLRDTLDDINEG